MEATFLRHYPLWLFDVLFDTAFVSDSEIGMDGLVDSLESGIVSDEDSFREAVEKVIDVVSNEDVDAFAQNNYVFLYCDRTHHGFFVAKDKIPEILEE